MPETETVEKPDTDGEQPKPTPPSQTEGEGEFPANTPTAQMTPEQQAAYWKAQSRKHEARSQARGDYDQIKAERDELKRAGMSADEQAVEDAKSQAANAARAEVTATYAKRLVHAEMRGALRGAQVPADRIEQIVGPLDHTHFLADDGEVDADKVSNYAAGFAPAGAQWPDMGQGNRGGTGPSRGVDAGRDLFASRRKK